MAKASRGQWLDCPEKKGLASWPRERGSQWRQFKQERLGDCLHDSVLAPAVLNRHDELDQGCCRGSGTPLNGLA